MRGGDRCGRRLSGARKLPSVDALMRASAT